MATPEEEVGKGFLSRVIGGRHSRTVSAAKVGLRTDASEVKKLNNELDTMYSSVKKLTKAYSELAMASGKALGGMGGTGAAPRAQNGMPMYSNSSIAPGRIGRPGSAGGAAGGAGSAMGGMRG